MNPLLVLTLLLTLAPTVFADEATPQARDAATTETSPDDKPAPELIRLDGRLSQEQKDEHEERINAEQYQRFVTQFREDLEMTMGRIQPTTANESLHALILTRLGDSAQALAGLNDELKKNPENPELLTAKAGALYEQKDYVGAEAAANAALQKDPSNQLALWVKHVSEARSPDMKLPKSPWDVVPSQSSVVSAAKGGTADADDRPLRPTIKIHPAAAPPDPVTPSAPPAGKSGPSSGEIAAGAVGATLLLGSGLLALGDRTKLFIEDHPYVSLTAVTGLAVVAVVLVVGTGGGAGAGGTMILATANSAPAATAGAAAVTASGVTVAGSAVAATATVPLLMQTGDSGSDGDGGQRKRRTTRSFEEAIRRLKIDENKASEALHKVKRSTGRGGNANVEFDLENGDIVSPENGDVIGNLFD